LGKIR
jgi:hypothetical protein